MPSTKAEDRCEPDRPRFNFPEHAFPPLDIAVVSRAIAEIWRRSLDSIERASREDHDRWLKQDGQCRWEMSIPFSELSNVQDQVTALLMAYEEGRTLHLAVLREELVRLHNLLPGPPIILPKGQDK